MPNRRDMLRCGFYLSGSLLVFGVKPDPAEAGFFDDIAGAVTQGLGFAAKSVESVVGTALNIVGQSKPAIDILAASPLSKDPRVAAALAGASVVADIKNAMSTGPVQAAPVVANATPQPVAMPVNLQRTAQPMPLRSSDEDFLRGDPYGYMRSNDDYLQDYLDNQEGEVVLRNMVLPPRRITGAALRPQGRPRGGFYPTRLSYADPMSDGGQLAPMLSMYYAEG
ncbi:MAG: hypothetical protein QM608_21810 [Caulobacter sp.]